MERTTGRVGAVMMRLDICRVVRFVPAIARGR